MAIWTPLIRACTGALVAATAAVMMIVFAPWTATGQGRSSGSPSSIWQDPVFQRELIGSFGINSNIEPTMTAEEEELHDQIARMVPDDPDTAIKYLEQLLKEDGAASARFDFLLGNIYFLQKDDRARAARHLNDAVEKFPHYRIAHKNLAIIYTREKRARDAIRHFTEAIKLGAGDGTTYGLLGAAYIASEEPVAAETAFRSAVMLSPEVSDWKLGLAQALFAQEKFAEVVSLMDSMIAANVSDPRLWLLQADAYLGEEEMLKAASNFEMLALMGEANAELLTKLGHIYVNEGMLDLAAEAYLEVFRQDAAGDIQGALQAAEVLMEREGLDQAQRLLGEVRATAGGEVSDEDKLRIQRLEAKIAFARGEDEEAVSILERVVDLDPLDGESLMLLGKHYGDRREFAKAYFKYERAASVETFEADAKVRHAQLLVTESKYPEAIPLLKRAQELKPRENVGRFLEELERYMRSRR